MNERLKTFYDQVGLDFENFQRVTVTKGDMEKFAELIVRECIDIAQDRANFPGFPPNDVNDIIDEIKEHFGVKE